MSLVRLDAGARMSDAVCHAGVAYLSGQVTSDTSKDIVGQTQDVLEQIDAILKKLGSDKSKLIRAEIFLKDINDFAGMNQAWEAWVIPGETPARATVEANLADKDWRVEIVITAAL